MTITVNGEERDIGEGAVVLSLLDELGLDPKTVVVQLNDDIVQRVDYAATALNDGDSIELVHFVGGG